MLKPWHFSTEISFVFLARREWYLIPARGIGNQALFLPLNGTCTACG